jgi:hypothetical protein
MDYLLDQCCHTSSRTWSVTAGGHSSRCNNSRGFPQICKYHISSVPLLFLQYLSSFAGGGKEYLLTQDHWHQAERKQLHCLFSVTKIHPPTSLCLSPAERGHSKARDNPQGLRQVTHIFKSFQQKRPKWCLGFKA